MHPALRHTYYYSQRGRGYSEEYQAVLDAGIGTAPSDETKTKDNTCINELKEATIWDDLDAFYMLSTDGDLTFTTPNWKNPATHQATITGGISRILNQGIKGDGVDDLFTLGIAPSEGVNYQLNDAEWGFWAFTGVEGEQSGGTSEGTNILTLSTNSTLQRINTGSSASALVDMSGTGFKAIERTTSTNITLYNNLVSAARTSTSTSRTTEKFTICGRATTFNATTFSVFWVGKALGAKNADLYTILATRLGV